MKRILCILLCTLVLHACMFGCERKKHLSELKSLASLSLDSIDNSMFNCSLGKGQLAYADHALYALDYNRLYRITAEKVEKISVPSLDEAFDSEEPFDVFSHSLVNYQEDLYLYNSGEKRFQVYNDEKGGFEQAELKGLTSLTNAYLSDKLTVCYTDTEHTIAVIYNGKEQKFDNVDSFSVDDDTLYYASLDGILYRYNQSSLKPERVTKLSELEPESSIKIIVTDNYCYYQGKKGWLYAYSFDTKKTDTVIKYVMCDTNICNNQLYASAENKVLRVNQLSAETIFEAQQMSTPSQLYVFDNTYLYLYPFMVGDTYSIMRINTETDKTESVIDIKDIRYAMY